LTRESDDHPWHEARIKAKQTRYAAEAVAPVFGKPAKRFAEQVERVTELLGEHQDAAVAAHTVSALAAGRKIPGPVGFALGLLHSFEQETMARQRKEFRKMWQDVSRPHWRRWLRP
jgi:CHAD domain-containing protein